jgi:hypothetical protein
MNKEFIPYEQALKLKELGFDEECLAHTPLMELHKTDYNVFGELKDIRIGLPLYQQAFRWFREKYGYMGKVDAFFYPIGYTFRIDNLKDEVIVSWGEPENDFETYEEAELACLNKLIELVKNI